MDHSLYRDLFHGLLLLVIGCSFCACNEALPGQDPVEVLDVVPLELNATVNFADGSRREIRYAPVTDFRAISLLSRDTIALYSFGYHGRRNNRDQLTLLLTQPGAGQFSTEGYSLHIRFYDQNFSNRYPFQIPPDTLIAFFPVGRTFDASGGSPEIDFGILIPGPDGSLETFRSRTRYLPDGNTEPGTLTVESIEEYRYQLPDRNGEIPEPELLITFSFDLPVGVYEGTTDVRFDNEALRDYRAEETARVVGTATLVLSSFFAE